MKAALTTLLIFAAMLTAGAQNFEAHNADAEYRLQKFINRYGTSERIYLNDTKNKTFDAVPGSTYLVVFVYNINDNSKRRMMVYEVGPGGAKINPKYPDYSKGYRSEKGAQAFSVRIDPPGTQMVKYKIDANASATVLIYKVKPGVN